MCLLRCPACNRKGEAANPDPGDRFRCPYCEHTFLAGDASSTQEHDIFADDSPPFFPQETSLEAGDLPLHPRWRTWIVRMACHCRLEPRQAIAQSLVSFARQNGFHEPPPPS